MKNKLPFRQTRILAIILISLFIMNIADYIFSVRALSWGIKEWNPLINATIGTYLFPILKIGLVSMFLLFIWLCRYRINRLRIIIMTGLWFTFVAYVLVTGWHIYGHFFIYL